MSQCLSAYECLTFSQVMRLHKRWAHATTHTDTMAICLSKKVVTCRHCNVVFCWFGSVCGDVACYTSVLFIKLMCIACIDCLQVVQDKVKVHMEEQAYLPALMELILPTDREESAGAWEEKTERDLGSEALRVAVLHGHFGHKLAI